MSEPKVESRSMTIADLIGLVVGFALALAALGPLKDGPPNSIFAPGFLIIFWLISLTALGSLIVSSLALARVIVYRRMPRAVEWLVILVAASLMTVEPLSIDRWMIGASQKIEGFGRLPLSYFGFRWLTGLMIALVVLAGLVLVRLTRSWFPPWLKTLVLAGLAILTIHGPVAVLSAHGADLFSPSEGFGFGDLALLHRGICVLIAQIPLGLCFGVPVIAMLSERIRLRRWFWTDWACFWASVLVGLSLTLLYRGEFRSPSLGWLAERALLLVWLVIVALLSHWVLIDFGPAWNRWIGAGSRQDSSTESASSTL
jgi:hypothetical protein